MLFIVKLRKALKEALVPYASPVLGVRLVLFAFPWEQLEEDRIRELPLSSFLTGAKLEM